MTRIMRDSTSPGDIPTDGTQLVAGYTNGLYAWTQADWDRFTVPHVTIDVNGTNPDADVLDVELGDATVATAVQWVRQKLTMPHDYMPVIYCSRSMVLGLTSALAESGYQPGHHYAIWLATLDGLQYVPGITGLLAVQWAASNRTGGHYDQSIVYDDKWKPSQPADIPSGPGVGAYLSEGNSGPMVREMQQRLAERGWNITVDGDFGPQTEGVVVAFQEDSTAHGWPLAADGLVGPETWAAFWNRPVT